MPKAIIKPVIKVKYDNAKLRSLIGRLKKEGGYVTVGVNEGAGKYKSGIPVALVATFHEFGAPAANVPERSFLRSALRDNAKLIDQWRVDILKKILDGRMTGAKGLANLGFLMAEVVRNRIKSGVPPPLKEATIRAKQRRGLAPQSGPHGGYPASTPLIDTTLLLRSIGFKVFSGKGKTPPSVGKNK